ncbi:putative ATPase (AAA+ superfamily) [Archaeoglobus sulfaticallidus PM70-1]|uniref:Putative ATPase (AAA+ superfamily) n=1 Tax=Archaeoglobus sulfaticallidus PM70-1 TaxID=387631 RepID=N0BJ83_9EURY|nr:AAA family ATPase [Archaeoglobus sulfaticallidus]AGK60506.1 putative ATPase (AAA+ superfamily) [Archaeoglobus sulfaticallidus PM70-1]
MTKKQSKNSEVKYLILKPLGYPLKASYHEYPTVDNLRVFEKYAKDQWKGEFVAKGKLLFDMRMFPDFAFEVVNLDPEFGIIGESTIIFVESQNKTFETEIVRDVTLDDVVGHEEAKKKVRIILEYLKNPEKFGKWAPKNVLFHGYSGTGKTMMAKALANEAKVPFLSIKSTKLIGEHVGDSARRIHELYDRARNLAPCIVFLDEFDAIALDRNYQDLRGDVSEVVNSLLTELDGIQSNEGICTIAATNRIEMIDYSIKSRFEEEIMFDLPSFNERLEILRKNFKDFPLKVKANLEIVASNTEGFSGRDLVEKVIKPALHRAIADGKDYIETNDLITSIMRVKKPAGTPPKQMFV